MRHASRAAARSACLGLSALALFVGCAQTAAPPAPSASMPAQPTNSAQPAPSTPSPTTPPPPSPSADPLLSALTATTARGTAAVDMELLTAAGGSERTLLGEGVVDFTRNAADLRWSGIEGTSREVLTEEGFFVEVEPGQWLAVDPTRPTPTSDTGLILRAIAGLRDPVADGSELVGGQPANRISGWLPAAGNAGGLGLTDPERSQAEAAPQARVQVTVWIDASGRIVQVLRSLQQAEPVAATSLVRLFDFGIAAPIESPSSIAATAR
ncbi:MAG: hypothetical protein ACKN9D_17810 [Actinomycetales bacterium]